MKTLNSKELYKFKGLWHGVQFKNVLNIFEKKCLESRTTQRYWKDGGFVYDNDRAEYEKSFFLKGWSTTRNKDYAMAWGDVVFLLDEEKIKRDFEVRPIAWNATIPSAFDFKKETEEFIVSNRIPMTYEEIEEEYYQIGDDLYDNGKHEELEHFNNIVCGGQGIIGYWKRAGIRTIDLNRYIKGFFICNKTPISCDMDKTNFEKIQKHPLFLGFYDKENAKKLYKKTERKNPKWQ